MIDADEELLSDCLFRLEELAAIHGSDDVDVLITKDASLANRLTSHPDISEPLRRHFNALKTVNRFVSCANNPEARSALALPGYLIEGELGYGGMGVVYQAHHLALRRTVAVKMMIAGRFANPRLIERFRQEAKIVAGLQHPNIVQVYEVGDADGVPFMAIEFVAGGNLAQRINGRPQSEKASAQLIAILASAIDHAHRQGVVHRDLKPSNVLITLDGVPKIADFGLARLLTEESSLTRTREAPGTPGYMAPEQARGVIEPAVDVYSLGAILYEMLIGRQPFLAATTAETLVLIQTQEPVPPRQGRPNLSCDLEAVCLKCLEKNPSARYESATDLAKDLERFLAGQPTAARPLGWLQRGSRWVKRRPMAAALVGVSCLALATIFLGSTWYSWRLADALAVSEQRRAEAVAMQNEVDGQRRRALNERDANDQYLYASRISLVGQLLDQGNVEEAASILKNYADGTRLAKLRGFEWHWLKRRMNSEWRGLGRHEGEVYGVAYSPDGKMVASGGDDGEIKFWDPNSGSQLRTFRAHSSCTNGLAYSPDGRWLASASCDRTVKLWQTSDYSLNRTFTDHSSEVMSLAFSPDGILLAAGGKDGLLCVWQLPGGDLVSPPLRDSVPIDGLAFSPNGKLLAAAMAGKGTHVWQTETWKSAAVVSFLSPAVAFTPDSREVIVADQSSSAYIYDVESGTVRAQLVGHVGAVQTMAVSPDGRTLAMANGRGAVILWDLEKIRTGSNVFGVEGFRVTGAETATGHEKRVQALAFSPDSRALATAGFDGAVKLWDLAQLQQPAFVLECPVFVQSGPLPTAALSSDLNRLTTVGPVGKVSIWDTRAQHQIAQYDVAAEHRIAVAPDGSGFVALPANANSLLLHDLTRHNPVRRSIQGAARVDRLWFSPSGRTVATVEDTSHLRVWDLTTGRMRFPSGTAGENASLGDTIFKSDGPGPLLCSDERLVFVTGSCIETINLNTNERKLFRGTLDLFHSVSSSPDGALVAVSHFAPLVSVVQSATGRHLRTLHLPDRPQAAVFSPDGRTLATRTAQGDIQIWHLQSGQEMMKLTAPTGRTLAMRYSEDGLALGILVRQGESDRASLYIWSSEVFEP